MTLQRVEAVPARVLCAPGPAGAAWTLLAFSARAAPLNAATEIVALING